MKIVVGTDGSEHATAAMRWAADEAEVNGADLEVMLVWSYLDQFHPDRSDTFDAAYSEDTRARRWRHGSARSSVLMWLSSNTS